MEEGFVFQYPSGPEVENLKEATLRIEKIIDDLFCKVGKAAPQDKEEAENQILHEEGITAVMAPRKKKSITRWTMVRWTMARWTMMWWERMALAEKAHRKINSITSLMIQVNLK